LTPTWVVIVVGLLGGALGSLVTTGMNISHERAAEFRAHMLNAAVEFSTGAIAALQTARNAAGEVLKDKAPLVDSTTGSWRPEFKKLFDAANGAVDDVLAKQTRVHLLFGDMSRAGKAAAAVTSQLRNVQMALEHSPDSIRDSDYMSSYSRNFSSTLEEHETFNLAALQALQQTWLDRSLDRWRLRRRSAERS
jgi:hypothetical protein